MLLRMLRDICVSPDGLICVRAHCPPRYRIRRSGYSEREASRSHTSSALDVSTLERGRNIFICLDSQELLQIDAHYLFLTSTNREKQERAELNKADLINAEKMQQILCRVMSGWRPPICPLKSKIQDRKKYRLFQINNRPRSISKCNISLWDGDAWMSVRAVELI